jgi:hypothetical protein
MLVPLQAAQSPVPTSSARASRTFRAHASSSVSFASTTPDGRRLYAGLERTLPERLAAALSSMKPEQRTALADGMEAWVALAGLGDVGPSMFGEPRAGASKAAKTRPEVSAGLRPER